MKYFDIKLIQMTSKRADELLVGLRRSEFQQGTAEGIALGWRCRLIEALERVKELEQENESLMKEIENIVTGA